jgi:hypothetical protein
MAAGGVVHFLPAQPVKQVCQLRVVVLVFHGQFCVGVRVFQLVLNVLHQQFDFFHLMPS